MNMVINNYVNVVVLLYVSVENDINIHRRAAALNCKGDVENEGAENGGGGRDHDYYS